LPGPVRSPGQSLSRCRRRRLGRQRRPFGLLSRVAARLGQAASPLAGSRTSCIANDCRPRWPPLLHYEAARRVSSPCTTSPPGLFRPETLGALGLPEHSWRFDHVEYHGQLSFLKAGCNWRPCSRRSPAYAREIQDSISATAWPPYSAIGRRACAAF
jgi:hypothetical protein